MGLDGLVDLADLRLSQIGVVGPSALENRKQAGRKSSLVPGWVRGNYIKGPLPLDWLERACKLRGGKAILATALAIWFLSGLRRRDEDLKFTGETAARFGVSPSAKSRALTALETAGLIKVERRGKKSPLVTILRLKEADKRAPSEQDSGTLAC